MDRPDLTMQNLLKQTNRVEHQMMRLWMSLVLRKPGFCIIENKAADQFFGNRTPHTAQLISAFVFATWMVLHG